MRISPLGMPLKLSEKHPDYPALLFGNYMFGGGRELAAVRQDPYQGRT